MGRLVSLFPECPIHLKVLVDITTETGNGTNEVRFMERIRGRCPSPGVVRAVRSRRPGKHRRSHQLSQEKALAQLGQS